MMKEFLYEIGKTIIAVFTGRNFLWHVLAIGVTFILVMGGVDWWFFRVTRGNAATMLGFSAGLLGFFVPVILPALMYGIGRARRNEGFTVAAIGSLQAIGLALIIIAAYKALTGRVEPDFLASVATSDTSREFNFGFLRYGIFWGWPSSHTGVAFALSTFLALWYRHKPWVRITALLYATFIALGAGVSFHWLSDVVAGAIIGSLVGYVIYERKHIHHAREGVALSE